MEASEIIEDSTKFWLDNQLRQKLTDFRQEQNMTQTEVANELGKDQVFVSNCERGRRRMDPVELIAFLEVYDKEIGEFAEELDYEQAEEKDLVPA